MASAEELLEQILAATEEQLRWQKVAVLPTVRSTVTGALTTTAMRRAYEMCDGSQSSSDIAKAVGTSPPSMSRWTSKWRDLGIAHEGANRRVIHLVSLESLGVPLEFDEKS